MAQHDYIISNQTFPNTRADINNVLSAIASNNSGTSAPTTQYAGQFWIDTTSSTWTLYIHDGSDDIQFATIDTSANTVNFIDSELGDNSVTTSKIADANVTSAKLSYPLTTFSSTGIDDNATSTAITIDSSGNVGISATSITTLGPNHTALQINGTSTDRTGSLRLRSTNGSVDSALWGSTTATYFGTISGHNLQIWTNGTERMRIDTSGNIGIGTSSPTARFDTRISTLTGKVAEFHNSSGYGIDLTVESNSGVNTISSGTTQGLAFATNSSSNERMRIDSSGRVGIGTTSPTVPLDVNGDVKMSATSGSTFTVRVTPGAGVWGIDAGTDASSYSRIRISSSGTGSQTKMAFFNTNGQVGAIVTSGTSTAYNTSSDYRLKENVSYDFDATTRLKQLKPARFNFIADADKTVDGFLAHEVQSVVPEAITGEKDAVKEDGTPDYQGIDQSKLVPLLVKTIQELEARITALENNQP